VYDESREDTRYIPQTQQMAPPRAMPPLYYGGYGQAPQIAQYGGYASNYQQPATDPFSNYNPQQGYGMLTSRTQNMSASRQDPGGRHPQISPSASDIANQFGSLSLAR